MQINTSLDASCSVPSLLMSYFLPPEIQVEEARKRHKEKGVKATGIEQNETNPHFKMTATLAVFYDLSQMSIFGIFMTTYIFSLLL